MIISVSLSFSTTVQSSYLEMEEVEQIGAPEPVDIFVTPEQLSEGLLTLSLMPRSRWQTLLNLDTIRVSPFSCSVR
jgi:U3 small nucleolar RNA-associated protein 21